MKPVTSFTLLVFASAVLFGCHSSTQNVQQNKSVKKTPPSAKNMAVKKLTDQSDKLIIDSTAAVFTIVDSVEIEKRKKKFGDDVFYTGADDFVFASSEAHNYLEKQNIRIIDANEQQFLKFVKTDRSVVVIKLDTASKLFNLYLFNPAKAPVNADMANVEAEYKKYFSKQQVVR